MAAVETLAGSHRRPGAVLLVATVAAIDLLVWGGDRRLVGGGLLPLWVIPVATTAVCAPCSCVTAIPWRCWPGSGPTR